MNHPCFQRSQKQALANLGVQAVYLFGSRAQQRANCRSDYDYAALMPYKGHLKGDELYFKLYDLFALISPRTLKNDVIDIIFLRDAGLELAFHVIRYGVILYDGAPKERLAFEERTTLLYCDYQPLLNKFDHAILQSI